MNNFFFTETEIGLGLTGFGVFFSFLGIIFFFDKGLLAIGNVSVFLFYQISLYIFAQYTSLLIAEVELTTSNIKVILWVLNQILFISGVIMTIGIKSSLQFFMKRNNLKVFGASVLSTFTFVILFMYGTISFGVGFFFVIIGWPIIGMASESYGFIVLFSGFWPTLAVFVQKIPVIGWVFQQPFIRSFFDRYRGKRVPV
ncbi:Vesicle transport protein, Got1/SFT2-like protein [Cynara cardunculus var. scolymus]|uniref:Vesicle transport protein, Got1/SFT2-like protein n=1 Tax=Cynara cardunculus var. scolymus TaxID=59895 RepID=A0A103XFG7_CYNCS|nr:Vesicle transport protein, Got1/SFT2-like protein [Cynara cardunculus var. scolymus]